jgi:hypothetical protein
MGTKPPPIKDTDPVQADILQNQKPTMILMLLIAAFCVPLMLFVKPLWVLAHEKAAAKAKERDDFNQIGDGDQLEMVNINSS